VFVDGPQRDVVPEHGPLPVVEVREARRASVVEPAGESAEVAAAGSVVDRAILQGDHTVSKSEEVPRLGDDPQGVLGRFDLN